MKCVTRGLSSARVLYSGQGCRSLGTSGTLQANHCCKLLVVGGGTGGCSTAAVFTRILGNGRVIVVEPATTHYYQPMLTLVGSGLSPLSATNKPMSKVLPKGARWINDEVVQFEPAANIVRLKNGDVVNYDFMVVAMGLTLNYDQIPGLLEGLKMPNSGVCSNYSPLYVERTLQAMDLFEEGNAVFTFPNTPVKCPGAPQKIVYLAEEYFCQNDKRERAKIIYNTSLNVLFGVKEYADALWKVVDERDIEVNVRRNLVKVLPEKREAIFEDLNNPGQKCKLPYAMLHVTPPQSAPAVVRSNKELVDETGFLEVDKETLQHVRFPNIFGIGDCTNLPTSKTAAAVSSQLGVLSHTLTAVMQGKPKPDAQYNGYTSCPLVTGENKCILAEFGFDGKLLETFPFSQAREHRSMYMLKVFVLPQLYWFAMLNGYWTGPALIRKILHLGREK